MTYKVLVIIFFLVNGARDPHAIIVPHDFPCMDMASIDVVAMAVRDDHGPDAQGILPIYKSVCVDQELTDPEFFEAPPNVIPPPEPNARAPLAPSKGL